MTLLDNVRDLWRGVGAGGRAGLILGLLLIIAGLLWSPSGLLRQQYGVLFSGLDAQDAANIVAELDRLKVPYRLGADESTIQVREDQVHATRLKLMGKGVALRGGVGFEIFNNTDFGMTEFAQKINYQRALQGELARTIMAFDEVQSARVHLVLPESGLFRKADQQPKASITLALKRGRTLQGEQVTGIQRLVAASVPGMREEAVTVLDQRGVALSRAAEAPGEDSAGGARFALKHEIETYLARKVVAVLDGTFGPGKALVSVDVTVNHEQVSVTQEDVLPAGAQGGEATGVVVRRRLSTQGVPRPPVQSTQWREEGESAVAQNAVASTSSQEVEYQSGRRVEQIVSKPGSIRRISVGVMLPHALEDAKREEISQVLSMAVGLNSARGDEIAISSVDRFTASASNPPAATPTPEAVADAPATPAQPAAAAPDWSLPVALGSVIGLVVLVALIVGFLSLSRQRRNQEAQRELQREKVLRGLRTWLREDAQGEAAERAT